MKLNPNSWFVRSYLGVKTDRALPRTICELVKVTITNTLMYIIAATLVGGWFAGLGTMIWAGVSDSVTMKDILYESSFLSASVGINVIVSVIVGGGLVITAIERYKEYRSKKRYIKWANSGYPSIEENPSLHPRGPSKVSQLIAGIWARIKDKTCVIITYENS